MTIQQFEDKPLAHFSYAIISGNEMAVIDPSRNPQPYYDYSLYHKVKIVAVIETHPHADFVSAHAEIARTTGAHIYTSNLLGAGYAHRTFDDGDTLLIGKLKLKAMNTPGHSPDSICIVAEDESGKDYAVFTGDTLFIGDVGRPDLRENVGNLTAKREELAKAMYHSLREKILKLGDHVLVYPAHGAGSLCGKALSKESRSTIGQQKMGNYAMQPMSETEFVKVLLEDQPFVPKYFGYDVELNKKGAPDFQSSVSNVPVFNSGSNGNLKEGAVIVDARPKAEFRKGHLKNSINIVGNTKFETWLGSIVAPAEKFYLIATSKDEVQNLINRSAKIGYETNILGGVVLEKVTAESDPELDINKFKRSTDNFTIIDVRNVSEVKKGKVFKDSISIPLPELRERVNEIPKDKPIVVHCAGGDRSATGSSIIKNVLKDVDVFDLGAAVKEFQMSKVN